MCAHQMTSQVESTSPFVLLAKIAFLNTVVLSERCHCMGARPLVAFLVQTQDCFDVTGHNCGSEHIQLELGEARDDGSDLGIVTCDHVQDKAVDDALRSIDLLESMFGWLLRTSSSDAEGPGHQSAADSAADTLPDLAPEADADAEASLL